MISGAGAQVVRLTWPGSALCSPRGLAKRCRRVPLNRARVQVPPLYQRRGRIPASASLRFAAAYGENFTAIDAGRHEGLLIMPAPYRLTPEQKAILAELREAFAEVHRAHQQMDELAQRAVELRTPWHEVATAIEATRDIVQTRYGRRRPG